MTWFKWLERCFTLKFCLLSKGTSCLNHFFWVIYNFLALIFHNCYSSTDYVLISSAFCAIFSCHCLFKLLWWFCTPKALKCNWLLKSGTYFPFRNTVSEKQICFFVWSWGILILDKVLYGMYFFNNIGRQNFFNVTFHLLQVWILKLMLTIRSLGHNIFLALIEFLWHICKYIYQIFIIGTIRIFICWFSFIKALLQPLNNVNIITIRPTKSLQRLDNRILQINIWLHVES